MSSTGTSQISAAISGVMVRQRSAYSLKPYVHFSTNSWSYRSSSMMTVFRAMASAASVPGRIWKWISAWRASQFARGSTTMTFMPRFIMSTVLWPNRPSGLDHSVSRPQTSMYFGSS